MKGTKIEWIHIKSMAHKCWPPKKIGYMLHAHQLVSLSRINFWTGFCVCNLRG